MMDGMASGQTCIVQVVLEYEEFRSLRQHRRNETVLKKRVLEFIYRLYQTGFRHFIVFTSGPVDFWLAELLYFIGRNDEKVSLSYSLYLVPEDAKLISEWTMKEYYWDEVVRHAKKIHWCRGYWCMPDNPLMLLDLTGNSISYEHCC